MDEIFLNFPELFLTGKYVKIKFKKRGHHTIFSVLEIITQIEQKRLFFFYSWFHVYGASCSKTDLHSKYMTFICVWLIFLNKINY